MLGVSDTLEEEKKLDAASKGLKKLLKQISGGPAPNTGAGGQRPEGQDNEAQVEALLSGWEGRRLLRLVVSLSQEERKLVVGMVQRVGGPLK